MPGDPGGEGPGDHCACRCVWVGEGIDRHRGERECEGERADMRGGEGADVRGGEGADVRGGGGAIV